MRIVFLHIIFKIYVKNALSPSAFLYFFISLLHKNTTILKKAAMTLLFFTIVNYLFTFSIQ